LAKKLKALKAYLKIWNDQVFGNMEFLKKALLEELGVLDGLEEERDLVAEKKLRKSLVINEIKKLLYWRRLVGDKTQGFFG
jgi:hypothetical protein